MTGPKLNESQHRRRRAQRHQGQRPVPPRVCLQGHESCSTSSAACPCGRPTRCCSSPIARSSIDDPQGARRAVANAQHNDEQDPEELFVKACFADEGPTLKRFTPRARGRARSHQEAHLPHHDRGRPPRRRPPRDRPGPRGQAHRRRPPPWRQQPEAPAPAAAPESSAAANAPPERTRRHCRRRSRPRGTRGSRPRRRRA